VEFPDDVRAANYIREGLPGWFVKSRAFDKVLEAFVGTLDGFQNGVHFIQTFAGRLRRDSITIFACLVV